MPDDDDMLLGRTGEFTFSELSSQRTLSADTPVVARIETQHDYYPVPDKLDREFRKARTAFDDYHLAASLMINAVRTGQALHVGPVMKPMSRMIDSVIRHPDAMIWMRRLQQEESYLVGHSVRTSILAAVLGRHMGLSEQILMQITLSALLCQIGKTRLPRILLEKPGPLTREEVTRIQGFVEASVDILENTPAIDADVIRIVANHHERFDGSGYPEGKTGEYIPVLARLVGLVDWVDAMTSVKPYTDKVVSTTEAMDFLYQQRNVLFQDQLVEEFIQAVGMYPNGNLVELSTGEVALVLAQDTAHRIQPSVLLVLDHAKQPLKKTERINLYTYNQANPDAPRIIQQALPVNAHDIDIPKLFAAYTSNRSWRKLF